MHFEFSLEEEFDTQEDKFLVIDTKQKSGIMWEKRDSLKYNYCACVIDQMGEASSKAQALKTIITNHWKFENSGHKIYILIDGTKAIGFIKIGTKNLFYR